MTNAHHITAADNSNPFQSPADVDLTPGAPRFQAGIRGKLARLGVVGLTVGFGLGVFFTGIIVNLTPIGITLGAALILLPTILGGILAVGFRTIFYFFELMAASSYERIRLARDSHH